MALKIKCPHCGSPRKLSQPYPVPGAEVHCLVCGRTLAITYPSGMVDRMRQRGVRFQGDPPKSAEPSSPPQRSPAPPAQSGSAAPAPRPEAAPPRVTGPQGDPPVAPQPTRAEPPVADISAAQAPTTAPPAPAPARSRPEPAPPQEISPPAPETVASPTRAEPTPAPSRAPQPDTTRSAVIDPDGPTIQVAAPLHQAAIELHDPAPAPQPASTPAAPKPEPTPVPSAPSASPRPELRREPTLGRLSAPEPAPSTSRPSRARPTDATRPTAAPGSDTRASSGPTTRPTEAAPKAPSPFDRLTPRSASSASPRSASRRTSPERGRASSSGRTGGRSASRAPSSAKRGSGGPPAPPSNPPRRRGGWWRRILFALLFLGVLGGVAGGSVVAGAFWTYSKDLPTVKTLGDYTPPTVTVVYDRNGERMGEIYEKRRYVVEYEQIPKHVQDAFIAAEDANFWTHGGVDYEGILRAIGRNVSKGRKAQGASTITMQVARNFLLTRAKTYERKIREVILSWRIEETFSKEHILYLYLNEIYLGSGAYGVEAAARTYFDKHIQDLTVAEAAILAGLPQRPSDYSPHRHWDKARSRQEYVLGQMKAKGYLDEAGYQAALAEVVEIHTQENEFLTQAPYFTEHVRRYLVETYGFDKIYNDGLSVYATTDLNLQKVARKSVADGVLTADNRVGWRGPVEQLDPSLISARLDEQEQALREEASKSGLRVAAADKGGGYDPLPAVSPLELERVYDGVVVEVTKKHAIVGVGDHRVIIPVSWTSWAYEPNPKRSWRYRKQRDMTAVLTRGDVIQLRVESLDSQEFKNLRGYPPAKGLPAGKIYQTPELEGALFAYRLSDGAVLSMVGGYDFENSEYNRATQARRQVGSTFKPIVYAAAIGTRKFTGGSLVQDAPLTFQTIGDKLWKPGNYGEEYEGNITLRRALQLSKNVCTVRVLDRIGLDPVFDLAGPGLRIGYNEPTCSRRHIKAGSACEGDRTPSAVSGMEWCSYCDPTSCPLVRAGQQQIRKDGQDLNVGEQMTCLDDPRDLNGESWCHSCDVNLRACDWLPIERIPDTDPCLDARQDGEGRVWCRTCDLSMGLGSSSLTMVELARAYSAFATYGHLVEPHFIEKVVDRDGTVIEQYEGPDGEWPRVMEPGVASVAHWLLREVATGGTGARTNRLGIQVAGKTGTTNDFFDAWFVGYNPDIITASWVGFDQPHSMGVSFTGGKTALPLWMDFMREAVPKDDAPRFKPLVGVEMVPIDERSGRVAIGGRSIPMLPGTAPTNVVGAVGQKTGEDLLIDDF